ncbi:DUF1367 family protein [Salmonella enterica subsp. enterica]|uniref:DUF1367 family protein n=1 Tax=Salmonella enterica TaxID=28901 RepID=UPI0012BD9D56|nr:DUF1367 family protein [Salmonella enterica]EBG6922926.1 DUF1367 family protein [Salmonella enterica subsp. enterica]EBW9496405.1 hypothetical protein [Salmonella enterica subsp. enterica serovar Brandenburg]ECB7382932.1 DUF1367 family protein [Salmonella enterica subsp. enterica serovar Brandenburg]ECN6005715.1 DUF1367 family protein [Salmonella enterica subsp. enterica serovar Brandenburg]EIS1578219.1 DUF1367 family protein [Salmonella enterica subsp. enterica serovar Brandenburg]
MAQTLYLEKTFQNFLIPVDPGTSEILQLLPTGQLLTGEFRKPRNYAFHKKFFRLLSLGYHYWTPTGGLVEESEWSLISGYIDFLSSNPTQRDALYTSAEMYLNSICLARSREIVLLKHFESFREWVTIQAGFYSEYIMPDGSRRKVAKSVSFASMDDAEFHGVYQSVLNVLWNYILRRKFRSAIDAENAAARLMSFAG